MLRDAIQINDLQNDSEHVALTAKELRETLAYDPETGMFRWLKRRTKRKLGVWFLGCDNGAGYRTINIDWVRYRAHRLAWLHVYGRWPDGVIDHINGDPSDNRIANLREASHALNAQNKVRSAPKKDGTPTGLERRVTPSGAVYFRVRIQVAGKMLHIGNFTTEAEGIAARDAAKLKYHAGYVPGRLPKPGQEQRA